MERLTVYEFVFSKGNTVLDWTHFSSESTQVKLEQKLTASCNALIYQWWQLVKPLGKWSRRPDWGMEFVCQVGEHAITIRPARMLSSTGNVPRCLSAEE